MPFGLHLIRSSIIPREEDEEGSPVIISSRRAVGEPSEIYPDKTAPYRVSCLHEVAGAKSIEIFQQQQHSVIINKLASPKYCSCS